MSRSSAASIEPKEIAHFSAQAADWWNPHGTMRPLHRLNPVRLAYILDQVALHFQRAKGRTVLRTLDVLDVGCGGGLLTEPLARLGGNVNGLDASEEAIAVARAHAKEAGLEISYQASSVEDLTAGDARFDLICALEIAEHVADLDSFVRSLSSLLKPNGLLILSTLNRTPKSFLLGIIAAEYVLQWIPRGTHQWKKFIRPSELVQKLEDNGMTPIDIMGMRFNPLTTSFELTAKDVAVNYLIAAVRD